MEGVEDEAAAPEVPLPADDDALVAPDEGGAAGEGARARAPAAHS
jgi:hypothetical protein